MQCQTGSLQHYRLLSYSGGGFTVNCIIGFVIHTIIPGRIREGGQITDVVPKDISGI